jgi:hypothetical protein
VGFSHSISTLNWVRGEISLDGGISDGILADLNKDGLVDILIISGGYIYVFHQTKNGFQKTPDDRIYFKHLGEFIDIGEVNPESQGLEILGLSEKGVKYFYLQGNHYNESPGYLISGKIHKSNHNWGPAVSDFVFDINKDGLDEIFLLHNNRFFLYRLDNSGRFVGTEIQHHVKLTTVSLETRKWPAEFSSNSNSELGYFFRPKISVENVAFFQDFNADNFFDLISGNIYFQEQNFRFKYKPQSIENRVSFANEEKQDIFLDIDGDGKLDKVLIEVKDILSGNMNIFPFAKIFIYMNQNNILSSKPNYFLKTLLIGDKSPFVDIDRDGDIDFISIWSELSPGSKENIIQVLTESTLKFTFRCYLFENEKGFSINPDIIIKSKIKYGGLSHIGENIHFDFSGDFNNDGTNDLCIREGPTYINIYLIELGPTNYSTSVIDIKIPREAEQFKILDMNNDGKSDILILTKHKIIFYFFK